MPERQSEIESGLNIKERGGAKAIWNSSEEMYDTSLGGKSRSGRRATERSDKDRCG